MEFDWNKPPFELAEPLSEREVEVVEDGRRAAGLW